MASFNSVTIVGNLARDVELRYTPGGTAVTDIAVAVNETWKDKQSGEKKEHVTFVDCTLFGRTAEVAGEYLRKGSSVLVSGKLRQDSWDDKETGKRRTKLKVVGEVLQMLGGKGEKTERSESQSEPAGSAAGGDFGDEVPF